MVLAILAGLGWGGYKVWKTVDPFDTVEPEGCRVTASGQSYDLDLEPVSYTHLTLPTT